MLELDGVSAGYGMTKVLRDVSLEVPDGKVVALLGANGAGKTTLLRAAARVIPLQSGSVRVDGADLSRVSPETLARRGVCYVPDGIGVFRTLSVQENLTLFAARGERKGVVERAAELFPVLGDRREQIAGTMSGGEQQMLALARAHLSGARVAMLDEVSLGLAPKIVDGLFAALRVLSASGMALLLVEQYVQRALAMADHVYLLHRGSIVFSGSPDDLDPDEVMRSYVGVDLSTMTR
jgi:branched-chain amino acid transport system ATP-binding protein